MYAVFKVRYQAYSLNLTAKSYKPMGLSGLEPPTSRLSGVRSNQLSYKPIFFCNLAATYSPTPSPVQYHRPLRSLPSCSGWERVLPLSASPPKRLVISVRAGLARSNPLCVSSLVQSLIYIFGITSAFVSKLTRICASKSVHSLIDN